MFRNPARQVVRYADIHNVIVFVGHNIYIEIIVSHAINRLSTKDLPPVKDWHTGGILFSLILFITEHKQKAKHHPLSC